MKKFLIGSLLVLSLQPMAGFADVPGELKSFVPLNIKPWLDEPVILEALTRQNAVTSVYDQGTIDQLDQEWRAAAESGEPNKMITRVTTGPVADFLRSKFESSGGAITEVILMDAKGLNVAATEAPSDFWQGDEPKFMNSFGAGPDGMDFGEGEYDDSSGRYQAQVSMPIVNPGTGELIGAITVGVALGQVD